MPQPGRAARLGTRQAATCRPPTCRRAGGRACMHVRHCLPRAFAFAFAAGMATQGPQGALWMPASSHLPSSHSMQLRTAAAVAAAWAKALAPAPRSNARTIAKRHFGCRLYSHAAPLRCATCMHGAQNAAGAHAFNFARAHAQVHSPYLQVLFAARGHLEARPHVVLLVHLQYIAPQRQRSAARGPTQPHSWAVAASRQALRQAGTPPVGLNAAVPPRRVPPRGAHAPAAARWRCSPRGPACRCR